MGDDTSSTASPAPAATVDRKSGAQLALALTVFALVLASNSIINESWLNYSEEFPEKSGSVDIDYGLTGFDYEFCEYSDCRTIDESYSDIHEDECTGSDSDNCSALKELHNAGLIAMIMLIVSSVVLFAATILQVLSMLGKLRRAPNMISSIGGILVGTSVLVWYLMAPEALVMVNSDAVMGWENLGQGFWMALIAASAGLVAGFSGTIQSWTDGPPRLRAHGVRAGLEMNEFVLKESSCGNHTLSILADSDLIRVDRIGASPAIKDVLATRRDSYTGFSHQRLDWLDDFKGMWWVISGATLISSFMISSLFLIPFAIAAILALMQLMDPERFIVSTNSGNHPFYINRWRSNRELTNLAMDLVDEAMIAVLRGEELDTGLLDTRANLIAERFSADRDTKQAAEQAAAAEKEVFMAAANIIPGPPAMEPVAPAIEATTPSPEPTPSNEPKGPQDMEMDWTTTEVSEQQVEAPDVEQTSPEEVAEEVIEEMPSAAPSSAPIPVPATAIPPPPPLPVSPALPLPPAALPMPPPALAGIPAPPALAGIPAPPPPAGAAMMPPMGMPQPVAPPPVAVHATPREDNLSDDEKDNLLGELS
jgi:hypothetical protein